MRAGLAHMRVVCPNSRCCYRSTAACAAAADARIVGMKEAVDFCAFRKFFLLLPQVCRPALLPVVCSASCAPRYRRAGSAWQHISRVQPSAQ